MRKPRELVLDGRTYEFAADPYGLKDIENSIANLLDDTKTSIVAIRTLLLRHCDTFAPEGDEPCWLVKDLMARRDVRERIRAAGPVASTKRRLVTADVSYGRIVSIGRYLGGQMRLNTGDQAMLCTLALWLGEGVAVGRGFDVFPTDIHATLPWGFPYRVLPRDVDWTEERQDLLRTLLRDGTGYPEALEITSRL